MYRSGQILKEYQEKFFINQKVFYYQNYRINVMKRAILNILGCPSDVKGSMIFSKKY